MIKRATLASLALGSMCTSANTFAFQVEEDAAFHDVIRNRNSWFGHAVGVDGEWMVVGAYSEWLRGSSGPKGAIHFFHRDRDGWRRTQRFGHPDGLQSSRYGQDMDMDGSTVAVGVSNPLNLEPGLGEVLVYERSGERWSLVQRIGAPNGVIGTRFGGRVWIDGDRMLVTAIDEPRLGVHIGVLYVYDRGPAGWTLSGTIVPPPCPEDTRRTVFARSADIQGTTVVSHTTEVTGHSLRNHLRVFEETSQGWVQTGVLDQPVYLYWDHFGKRSIVLEGDWMAVADPGLAQSRPGRLYMYERTGNGPAGFEYRQTLFASNASSSFHGSDLFGASVDIEGDRMLVGAAQALDFGRFTGQAYLFELRSGVWVETTRYTTSDILDRLPSTNSSLGEDVALSGDYVVVGDDSAHDEDDAPSGGAFVYETELGTTTCFGAPNSLLWPASLSAKGSGVAHVGAVTFRAEGLPFGAPTVLLASPAGSGGTPVFDTHGLLCLATPVAILEHTLAAADAQLSWRGSIELPEPGVPSATPIAPGETWHFQAWYRDSHAGRDANLTSSLEIAFR